VPFEPVFSSDEMVTLKEAASHGLGIVALPAYTCTDELAQNKLVRILPEWNAGIAELSLLLPTRKGLSGQAQLLRDYLLSEVDKHLAITD
jgi:DNA-binding transcriptional LysR family regulator